MGMTHLGHDSIHCRHPLLERSFGLRRFIRSRRNGGTQIGGRAADKHDIDMIVVVEELPSSWPVTVGASCWSFEWRRSGVRIDSGRGWSCQYVACIIVFGTSTGATERPLHDELRFGRRERAGAGREGGAAGIKNCE